MNGWKKLVILLFAVMLILPLIGLTGCPSLSNNQQSAHSQASIHNEQGNTLLKQGKYDEAIAEYNKSLEVEPTSAVVYTNRGIAYFNKDEWDLAIADFTKALELDPGYADAYFDRGLSYENINQNELAIADYDSFTRLSKDADLTQKAMNRIGYLKDNQTTQGVQIFPREVTVDLDWPQLLLYADVNSLPIEANSTKYRVEWYCNGKLISTESSLTTEPFLEAIGNQKGTYTIDLVVLDKLTGEVVGKAQSTVIAEKQEPIIIGANHWVSATPGEGLKTWNATGTGVDWWGYEVDLRIQGSTGTLTTTFMTCSPSVPEELRGGIGTKSTTSLANVKDDGTNIEFSFITGTNGQMTTTFKLARTADGHLKGSYHLVDKGGETFESGGIQGVTLAGEWIGTVDLVPAP